MGFAVAGAGDVGSRAEIPEVAVLVDGDGFALGDVADEVEFVLGGLIAFGESGEAAAVGEGDGFFAGDFDALEGLVLLHDFFHLGLDGFEVVGGEAVLHVDVVVEPRVDGGADGELGVGPEAEDGGGHDVGGRVAEGFLG